MPAVLLALFPTSTASAPLPVPQEPSKPAGCTSTFTRAQFRQEVRTSLKRPPFTARERKRVKHVKKCRATRSAGRRMHIHLVKRKRVYRQRFYWRIRHAHLSSWDRQWAYSTSMCESGRNPRIATGNGFYGAHQWMMSTWHAAGGSGSPVTASIWEQDVRAVRWRNVAGRGQWPNCG